MKDHKILIEQLKSVFLIQSDEDQKLILNVFGCNSVDDFIVRFVEMSALIPEDFESSMALRFLFNVKSYKKGKVKENLTQEEEIAFKRLMESISFSLPESDENPVFAILCTLMIDHISRVNSTNDKDFLEVKRELARELLPGQLRTQALVLGMMPPSDLVQWMKDYAKQLRQTHGYRPIKKDTELTRGLAFNYSKIKRPMEFADLEKFLFYEGFIDKENRRKKGSKEEWAGLFANLIDSNFFSKRNSRRAFKKTEYARFLEKRYGFDFGQQLSRMMANPKKSEFKLRHPWILFFQRMDTLHKH